MLGNGVEMSLIFSRILGPLSLGWAPNQFVLGTQVAPDEKQLVCILGLVSGIVLILLRAVRQTLFFIGKP